MGLQSFHISLSTPYMVYLLIQICSRKWVGNSGCSSLLWNLRRNSPLGKVKPVTKALSYLYLRLPVGNILGKCTVRTSYSLHVRGFCASDCRRSWLSFPRNKKQRLQNRWPASRKKRASWMLKCPNGMTVATTSLCWPSRCAWLWWRWPTSPGEPAPCLCRERAAPIPTGRADLYISVLCSFPVRKVSWTGFLFSF